MSGPKLTNPVARWIDHRLPVFTFLHHEMHEYPTPKNLNYWWNFGSLAGITLVIMIVTGIILSMHYTAHVDHAFQSVERIMRDVNYGWLIRYIHANGASFFFIVVYIHIFRGLYYGSYKAPRELLWMLGRLHTNVEFELDCTLPDNTRWPIDEQDFSELLGNLADNAGEQPHTLKLHRLALDTA